MSELPSPSVGLLATLIAGLLVSAVAGCGSQPPGAQGQPTASGPSSTSPASASPASASAAVVYDLGRDFSFTANPNGPWRYGYTSATQLTRAAFAPVTVTETTPSVTFWHPGQGRPGYYPYIAANPNPSATTATVSDQTGSWALRPGEVALEASATGQFAAIEFTVPRAGNYAIAADFAGIHKGLSTTDAHVLLGDESLFTAMIDGYGGDPAFFPHRGASPTATYRVTRALKAGDVLTFAIGYGANRAHQNDTTGLIVTIRALP